VVVRCFEPQETDSSTDRNVILRVEHVIKRVLLTRFQSVFDLAQHCLSRLGAHHKVETSICEEDIVSFVPVKGGELVTDVDDGEARDGRVHQHKLVACRRIKD